MKIDDDKLKELGLDPKEGKGELMDIDPNDPRNVMENLIQFVAMCSRGPDDAVQYLTLASSIIAPTSSYQQNEAGSKRLAADVMALSVSIGRSVMEQAKQGDPRAQRIVAIGKQAVAAAIGKPITPTDTPMTQQERELLEIAMRNVKGGTC